MTVTFNAGLGTLLLLAALVCFVIATIGWPRLARINVVALGLALWVLEVLLGACGH
jgi:hypothetical protein